jgi:sulfur-carrier protein adenylyltransferase/sulfurtransferase
MNIEEINVTELKERFDQSEPFELIDVREQEEHEICHIKEAQLVPLSTLTSEAVNWDTSKEYIVMCKMGGRSARACEWLLSNGFENVRNVEGGIMAWAEEIDPTMEQY